MRETKSPKVVWLTNLPAPYRFPIWDHMAELVNLHVVFALKRRNWRDWPEPGIRKWKHSYLGLNSIQIKEHDFIPSFRGTSRILRDVDVAIVGGWENLVFMRTILLAKKRRISVIQFYESTDASQRFTRGLVARIRKWIFQKPDSFLTISQRSASTLVKMGIDSKKIQVLFNPADVSWFYQHAQENRMPSREGHHYLYIGQLVERKNVASVIRAFYEVRESRDCLTIAGRGPLESKLRILVQTLGLENTVNFMGHVNQVDVANLFANHETLILASTNEVWGLVVNEALASGLHVVVSNNCGVAELVQNMTGVEICGDDVTSISNSMSISRKKYTGKILNPEILNYSPNRFADYLLENLRLK